MFNIFAAITIEALATPVLIMVVLALGSGILLTFAARIFHVPTDPQVDAVREVLPGVNCGACGYVGCDAYAQAVATEGAEANLCVPGGAQVSAEIARIVGGGETGERKVQVARVRCQGSCQLAKEKYVYSGISSCAAAAQLFDGHKSCSYGCLGHGDCVRACPFDAIDIVDEIAVINQEKCMSCRKCVAACPKHLIEMVDEEIRYTVLCRSEDRGPAVRKYCDVGCIGCTRCVKACPERAITMQGALAYIDYTKCTNCNKCAEVCPTNAIIDIDQAQIRVVKDTKPSANRRRKIAAAFSGAKAKIDPDATAPHIVRGHDAAESTVEAAKRPVKDSTALHTIAQTGRMTQESHDDSTS